MNTDIELEALITEREGMLAENTHRINRGYSIAYDDKAFLMLADRMRALLQAEDTTKQDYEKDILILALRLLGENPDTFSPEVAEVMMKWENKVKSVLAGEHVYEL